MHFQLQKSRIFIGLAVIGLLTAGVWVALRRQHVQTPKNANAQSSTAQTLGSNGVTFTSPAGLDWVDAGSTAGNYSNLILYSTIAENVSSIEVSIPLKETGESYTLADVVKPFADVSGIHPTTLNGHSGEAITYRQDTRSRKDDIPWVGTVTKEKYPSPYSTSPVGLEYSHGDGDDSLDVVWEQVKSSLTW